MILYCICRSSFDSSVTLSKRKAQTEGEDTEEDVEEQKVTVIEGLNLHELKKSPTVNMS